MKRLPLSAAALALALAAPVFARPPAPPTEQVLQRNVNQAARIDQGLESGQLTTREASRLQAQEARIDRVEANSLRDGQMTPQEQARVNRLQNRASRDIRRQKHDAQVTDPDSASSQRMQAAAQRNLNQQTRILQGAQSGSLTSHEVSRLERGQAHAGRVQARAGADGQVGAGESARIQQTESVQSRRIHRQKHDAQTR